MTNALAGFGTNSKAKKSFFSFPFKIKKDKNILPKSLLPKIKTKTLPGPQSQKWLELLKRYECAQITYVGDVYPVFFKKANACNIYDVDGNRFLDLSSCFGVGNFRFPKVLAKPFCTP